MCIECKRLVHTACLRTKKSLPQALIIQFENSRNNVCYACKECLPYKIYDTPLYSEEQARRDLILSSVDTAISKPAQHR